MSAVAGHWRVVFAIAALFNLVIGVGLLFFADALLRALGMDAPTSPLFVQLAGGLIATFGLAYALAARDPMRNREIVLLGAIGKAPVPLLVWLNVAAGHASQRIFLLSLGDLVFAALFVAFLLRTRAV